ncbi:MAG: Bax inhibitor-1 family protein [Candidatus Lightella neohaematopini]|nr:Bax inhibitor-1 family protein [Candidatus Lightella neohaematopini]MCV2528907.1 Bax inhibitor-1 family protein [Candidatus Lightella neohaematopini]
MNQLIKDIIINKPILNTNKVLRNTYFLLFLTLAFSGFIATISTIYCLPSPGLLVVIIGFYSLLFLTQKLSNSIFGIFSTFALTGFMGYTLGPTLSKILFTGANDIIILSLIGTALILLFCSLYIFITKKNMSFLTSIIVSGFLSLFILIAINSFLNLSIVSLTISIIFIICSSTSILWEISNIIYGGENNYIRATISLYVSLYNVFVSLISSINLLRR